MYLEKKFKRLAENEKIAKVKWRRIMSVFLAAAMFVSGGAFSDLARIGLTAVAEETAEQDFEETYFAEDINILAASGDVTPEFKIEPEINSKFPNYKLDFDKWENWSAYDENNPYILRAGKTITVYGITGNFQIINPNNPYNNSMGILYQGVKDDKGSTFEIATDADMWLEDLNDDEKNIIEAKSSVSFQVETDSKGQPTGRLIVMKTFGASTDIDTSHIANGRINFNNGVKYVDGSGDYSSYKKIYITARPQKSFIEVYSEVVPDRDMNKVNEYIDGAYLGDNARYVYVDSDDNNAYVRNTQETPYLLHSGDSVYIRSFSQNGYIISDVINKNVSVEKINVWHIDGWQCGNFTSQYHTDPKNQNGDYAKYTVNGDCGIFCVTYDTGIAALDGQSVYEKFYFSIYDQTGWRGNHYDHADIEIADGGTYTITRDVWVDNGSGVQVQRTYQIEYYAHVADVNKCEIYGTDKTQPLKLNNQYYDFINDPTNINIYSTFTHNSTYDGYSDNDVKNLDADTKAEYVAYQNKKNIHYQYANIQEAKRLADKVAAGEPFVNDEEQKYKNLVLKDHLVPRGEKEFIPSEDYWQDPRKQPGDQQFELTSKYIRTGANFQDIDIPSIGDNLRFKMNDIDTAIFYVELLLKPKSLTVYDENNQQIGNTITDVSILNSTYSISDMTVPNVEFEMSHQSVLDAYNKCPDHSGLDFTLMSDISAVIKNEPVKVPFDANKVLKNKTLENGEFEFELWYISSPGDEGDSERKIQTVSNNSSGEIKFDEQPLFVPGKYEYRIEEKTGTNGLINYDKGYIKVTFELEQFTENNVNRLRIKENTLKYEKFNSNDILESVSGDLANKTFTNTYKVYNLPSTGGPGVYIFIISGAGFILAAAVMLYRKKRKEE